MDKQRVTLFLDPGLVKQVKFLGIAEGKSMSGAVEMVLEAYISPEQIVKPKTPKKVVKQKSLERALGSGMHKFCQHGAMIGLCKHGCKK